MKFIKPTLSVLATLLTTAMAAFPSINDVSPDNVVYISSESVYCMIFPKYPHMDIGTSEENPGNTQTLCTYPYNATLQGTIPQGFFRSVAFAKGVGITGQPYVQLTGCIVPQLVDRLNPADSGGQYDSNGGVTLQGNPIGSQCLGYASYVQLIEPGGPRACIRCCIDPVDCPVTLDTSGCPTVIPGNYFDCGY